MRKVVIVRGTNPKLSFRAPQKMMYDSAVTMTISQKGEVIIEKECAAEDDGEYIEAVLEEDETLKLRGGSCAEIQFRYTIGDEIFVSPIATAEIGEKIGS